MVFIRKQKFYCNLCGEFGIEKRTKHLKNKHHVKISFSGMSKFYLYNTIFKETIITKNLPSDFEKEIVMESP